MNITITINFWFLVSLCLLCVLLGMVINARINNQDNRRRY